MGRLSVFVATRLLDEIQRDLTAAFDVTFLDTRKPAGELTARDSAFDALLVSLDTPLPAREIDALPASVRAIATYSVGTDHIDLIAAKRRDIAVFNTPGVLADSVAENAIFLMLGAARRATESIALVRSGTWQGWSATQLVGMELSGKRLGIVGLGDIGGRIAVRARALGMQILYSNRRPLPAGHAIDARFFDSPGALIAESDVLVLACPSTADTHQLVDAKLLALARPGLILVNIARGDLVDDAALIAALRDGRVGAAGLDVFAGEPQIDPAYFELQNVFMLPHIGSSTIEARRRMGAILIEALSLWAEGGSPENRVY
ncbi:MAG: D-glycerate dehydrogenase [bacterium]|nr:D-glycerate dehydrogenase [bacterium]